MQLRSPARIPVTVLRPVPDWVTTSLALDDGQVQVGSVLQLPPSAARALVLVGSARYGSAAHDATVDPTIRPNPGNGGGAGGMSGAEANELRAAVLAAIASLNAAGGGGSSSADTYLHTQLVETSVWTVHHNLGRMTVDAVVYSLDYSVQWDGLVITPLDLNTCRITFEDPTSGTALIS